MEEKIKERLARLGGRVGFYWEDLATGETMAFHAAEPYLAASVIKLPVCAAVLRMAGEGRASLDERLPVRAEDMVPSCGTLRMIAGEVDSLSVRALCRLMLTVSDNSATNLLLRRFGLDALNAAFRALGLTTTHLERILFDREAAAAGRENYFVPAELGALLRKLYRRELNGGEADEFLLETLFDQQINHKIPGYLPAHIRVAHKTGEDDGITNDVGVVMAARPFVLAFACNGVDVPAAERAIREISLWLTECKEVL